MKIAEISLYANTYFTIEAVGIILTSKYCAQGEERQGDRINYFEGSWLPG